MKTLIKSLSLILALYLQSAGISYGVQLNSLETEYLSDPLGLDTPSPRMSWRIQSDENGQKQTAYRIIVSSSKALAESGKGDLWDSGKVDSDQSFLVQYEGQALQKNDDGYPGMKRFAIRPSILKGLGHAKAERHSPYGTIQSEWKKSDDQLTLTVAIPVNTVAEVELPGLSNVTVNGRPLQEVAEVTVIRKLENTIILEVQSGKYRFYLKR